jgi:hypothetical protein
MTRRFLSVAFSFFLTILQTNSLTPVTGRIMLQQRVTTSGNVYQIDYSNVAALVREPSFVNFANIEEAVDEARLTLWQCEKQLRTDTYSRGWCDEVTNEGQIALNRLIKAGVATEKSTEASVVNLSGTYEGDIANCYHVVLNVTDSTPPKVAGNFKVTTYECVGALDPHEGTFTGILTPSSKLFLSFDHYLKGFYRAELTINTSGNEVRLEGLLTGHGSNGTSGSFPLKLKAQGERGLATIKQYDYNLAPEFYNLGIGENAIKAGGIKIDRLENLILVNTVEAEASFYWHTDFNRVAQALTGKVQQSGVGRVMFRKQPDGRWVVWNYQFQ